MNYEPCLACKRDGFEDVPTQMLHEHESDRYARRSTEHWECLRGHVTVREVAWLSTDVLVWELGGGDRYTARAALEQQRITELLSSLEAP